jgi:hypothetical protein
VSIVIARNGKTLRFTTARCDRERMKDRLGLTGTDTIQESAHRRGCRSARPATSGSLRATRRAQDDGPLAATSEWFIEEVRGDEPELAAKLRIEERELEAGGLS